MRAMIKLPSVGGLSFVREMLAPAATAFEQQFAGQAVPLLLSGNALHADIPLDSPGSGFLGLLLIMMGQSLGYPVPQAVRASSLKRCATASWRTGRGGVQR